MANIFRVVKDKNYTIVNNEYLKNKNLRVDSIGLLTIILSLPSDFNITMKGLISLTHQKANYRAIKAMLDNLKENGYLEITKLRDEKGHFFFDYIFFESNRLNPLYTFYIVDDANQSVINDNKTNSPPPTNPPTTGTTFPKLIIPVSPNLVMNLNPTFLLMVVRAFPCIFSTIATPNLLANFIPELFNISVAADPVKQAYINVWTWSECISYPPIFAIAQHILNWTYITLVIFAGNVAIIVAIPPNEVKNPDVPHLTVELFIKWKNKISSKFENYNNDLVISKIEAYVTEKELLFEDALNNLPEYNYYLNA